MSCCQSGDFVQGIGITPYKNLPVSPTIFTEMSIPGIVKIPNSKPGIEALLSVTVDAKIVSVRLIKTAKGLSNEGQYLSGYKLKIELKLRQKVKYIADELAQSVHADYYENIINNIFVVVPPEIGEDFDAVLIETLFKEDRLMVTPYIEDIYAELKDKRTIFKNITMILNITSK